ncbi:hypothetical protein PBR_1189 [Segatella baroniae B14]|uniref:Uncharacterized protein n=1 Tax=Segatella baroniae B14 TaxID=752555 RepID=D8DZ78_9BACT|nr:hypothetical protein PBR_1189 [Segatella baroniae B14]
MAYEYIHQLNKINKDEEFARYRQHPDASISVRAAKGA